MDNFVYYTPTRIIFGKGVENSVGEEIKKQGCSKVLVHFGGQSAKKSGLLDRVYASLDAAGVDYVSLGGVVPNPRLSLCREGIALCKKEKVDFLLAVGGGSVIDSAKCIGYGLANDCDVWDIYTNKVPDKACAPIGVVLTISAAGSEMSNSSVITNEDGWLKRGHNSDVSRPKFAMMNPELTYTLPPYQTASGGTDILMHTMERYFTVGSTTQLTDKLCESLLTTVMKNLSICMEDPTNYEARAEVMWAGSLSHNGLMEVGRGRDFATHQLEHELGGMFDVAHGAGLAALWGSWARYVLPTDVARFAQFAVNVMGCEMDYHDPEKTALQGIAKMEDYFRSIGMPTNMKELGLDVTDEQIKELAYKCSFFGARTIGQFQKLNQQDMEKIYQMARG